MKKVELLAPAGSFESFLGAIHAGADAVYIGGQKYGARAYAENFTEEEVCLAIRYAHLFEKKLYLTVNTLLRDEELAALPEYIRPFYEAGLDGVIIQDLGVLSLLKECFPLLELHGSTQMTITGAYGARFLLEQGASRVVPARELSLEEIRRIKDTGIEVEAFIHGAMCYCYSGQCLFSSMLGGRSGNRGRCAQPCRLPYQVAGRQCYPLSLKDMCTLSLIPELIESGIDSFKIEGRMKKPEYAAGVTALYRKYIDRYYAAPSEPFSVEKADMEKLRTLYIRSELQDGYYHRHNGREMITPDKPSYLGADEEYLKQIRKAYLECRKKLPIAGSLVLHKGQPARLELHKLTADGLSEAENGNTKAVSICQLGAMTEAAQKQPLTEEMVRKQLEKTGNTPFALEQLTVDMEQDVFLPVKALNDLRREALRRLEEALTADGCRVAAINENKGSAEKKAIDTDNNTAAGIDTDQGSEKPVTPYLAVQVGQAEQLMTVLRQDTSVTKGGADRIYLEADMLLDQQQEYDRVKKQLSAWKGAKTGRSLFFVMPVILRLADEAYLRQLREMLLTDELWDGVMIRNLESLQWLREQDYKKEMIADACLYVWNRWAKQFLRGEGLSLTAPLECNKAEWHQLGLDGMEIIVYGRSTLMVTANCVRKTVLHCLKEKRGKTALSEREQCLSLRDRYQTQFPVRTVCRHCYNEIYNSVPLSLHDYGRSVLKETPAGVRLVFTTETEAEVSQVLDCYDTYTVDALQKRQADFAYTKGHYKRGAE